MIVAIIKNNFKAQFFPNLQFENLLLYRNLQVVVTFGLVCFSWIFFRANNLDDLKILILNIFKFDYDFSANWMNFKVGGSIFLIFILQFIYWLKKEKDFSDFIGELSIAKRWMIYIFFTFAILYLGKDSAEEFIYFQF